MADKNTHIESAQKFLQKNQLDRATKEYYRALELDPRDVRVRHKLGEILARQGTRAEALKELGIVAETHAKEGFYLRAVAVFKQMVRLKEDLYDIHLRLGDLYRQLSLLSEAQEHYRLVADYYEVNGTSKECIEVFKKLCDLIPDDLVSRQKLAEFYIREEKFDDGFALYESVGKVLREQKRFDDLMRIYDRLLQLRPSELPLYKQVARLALDAGDARKALSRLQVCFKADPGDSETLSLLGETFVNLEQFSKARSVYKELVRIYEYQGLGEQVKETWERVRRIDPDDEEALKALGLWNAPPVQAAQAPVAASSRATGGYATPAAASSPSHGPATQHRNDGFGQNGAPTATPSAGARSNSFATPVEGSRREPIVGRPVSAPVQSTPAWNEPAVSPARAVVTPMAPSSPQRPRPPSAMNVPLSSPASGSLRDVPASVSKLMTETEVYLKYQLTEKALGHLKQILEKEPGCYLAREKRRDLLSQIGRTVEAAVDSEKMAMLASSLGDQSQAKLDLERAVALDPGNLGYQHALAALSIMARPAQPGGPPPPFFSASSVGMSEIEVVEDDEDDEEADDMGHAGTSPFIETFDLVDDGASDAGAQMFGLDVDLLVDESGMGGGSGGFEDLVDDGDALSSIYLTLGENDASISVEGMGDVTEHPAKAAPPPPTASVPAPAPRPVSTPVAVAPPAPTPAPAKAVVQPAKVTPAPTPVAVKSPEIEVPEEIVFDLFGGEGDGDFVDDEAPSEGDEGMDMAQELQMELLMSTGELRRPETMDRTPRALELARAYLHMGLIDAAFKELEKCREQGPLGIEAMRLMGQCHFKRGDYADAVYWCQSVLNRNDLTETQELEALFDLGQTYEVQGDLQHALDLFEEIASLNEHFRRGEVAARVAAVSSQLESARRGAATSAR